MKRRSFVKRGAVISASGALMPSSLSSKISGQPESEPELYELRKYYLKWGRPRADFDNYWKDAAIPALNRNGVKAVGVFEEIGDSTPSIVYILISHPSMQAYTDIAEKVSMDAAFKLASNNWNAKSSSEKIYLRYDTWLLKAFSGMPEMISYETSEPRMFELRTYEGHNNDAVRRKIMMFDTEEIPVFHKTGLYPVFFGKMIAGPAMPALTYMLRFKDMEERDANWQTFQNDPEWQAMRVKSEYADSVCNIVRVFLKPADYSQI